MKVYLHVQSYTPRGLRETVRFEQQDMSLDDTFAKAKELLTTDLHKHLRGFSVFIAVQPDDIDQYFLDRVPGLTEQELCDASKELIAKFKEDDACTSESVPTTDLGGES